MWPSEGVSGSPEFRKTVFGKTRAENMTPTGVAKPLQKFRTLLVSQKPAADPASQGGGLGSGRPSAEASAPLGNLAEPLMSKAYMQAGGG